MRKIPLLLLTVFSVFSLCGAVLKTGTPVKALPSPLFVDGSTKMIGDFYGKKFVVLYIFEQNRAALDDFAVMHEVRKRCADIADFVGIGIGTVEQLKKFPGVMQFGYPVNADKGKARGMFVRDGESLPLAVVLDKKGVLLWRGPVKAAVKTLNECANGKFDLKEQIRQEVFTDTVNDAIRNEKFDIALPMLKKEFAANPRKLELLRVQLAILKKLNRIDEAFAELRAAQVLRPRSYRIFEMEYQLIGETKKVDRLPDFFERLKKNFAKSPGVLLGFALSECKLPPEQLEFKYVFDLVETGWNSKAFAKDEDKGMYALDYAKIFHSVGRNDLAAVMARQAQVLLAKNAQGAQKAKTAFLYYTKMMQIAPKVKLPDLKK